MGTRVSPLLMGTPLRRDLTFSIDPLEIACILGKTDGTSIAPNEAL